MLADFQIFLTMLTPAQHQAWLADGYLHLPDFVTPAQIAAVRARAAQLIDEFDPSCHAIFSTDRQKHQVEQYFMESSNTIRCFFEEEAFTPDGGLKQNKSLSINKIGHALHDLDEVFCSFSRTPQLAQLAQELGLMQPQIWQSMYICKQPKIGGKVDWHQDASFFVTEPVTVTTFWFALEDATLDNGCLWVQPGGHRGPLRERFVKDGSSARLEQLDATPWPSLEQARALPVAAGSLLVFHGLLPHYSAPNRSPHSRHAYTLHVTDGRSRYSDKNWISRPPDFPVRGFA